MNILVTGGNGQLGTELKKYITDRNTWLFLGHNELDILNEDDVKEVIKNNDIDIILNCAAYTNFDEGPNNVEKVKNINEIGPRILAESIKSQNGIVIHVSTDYVFDGNKRFGKYKPESKTNPLSVYGITKRNGENNVINSGANYLIFRVSWLYGGDRKNFVRTIFDRIGEENELKIVSDQIGTPTYVTDFAKFLIHIVDNFTLDELKTKTGLYHYANKGKTSWWNLGNHTKKYRKKYDKTFTNTCKIIKIKTEEYMANDVRPKYSPLSVAKTEQQFKVFIRHWKSALKDCIIKYIKYK